MEHLRLLPYHNLTRWLVLLTALWALIQAWHGLVRDRKWTRRDSRAGLSFTTVANIQFLLGVALYVTSPNVKPLFAAPAYALSSGTAFFLTTFHPSLMFLAVGLAQAVYSVSKRVSDDRSRFRWAAFGYSLVAALMIAAVPWPPYSFGRPLFRPFVLGAEQENGQIFLSETVNHRRLR